MCIVQWRRCGPLEVLTLKKKKKEVLTLKNFLSQLLSAGNPPLISAVREWWAHLEKVKFIIHIHKSDLLGIS